MQYLLLQSDLLISILELYIYTKSDFETLNYQTQFNIYYANNANQDYKTLCDIDKYVQKIMHTHHPSLHTSVICAFVTMGGYAIYYYHMAEDCISTNYDEHETVLIL